MKRTFPAVKSLLAVLLLLTIMLSVTACSSDNSKNNSSTVPTNTSSQQTSSKEEQKFLYMKSIESKFIAENKINEPSKKDIVVSLPPSYYKDENKRYPVVYFFHGYSEGPGAIANRQAELNSNMTKEGAKEFIVIEISGENKHGGSFYVNSPVIGNWEDFVIKEVIPYVDSNYRTIASKDSRGACGFSMGGFASLNLALRNPDVFSSVYSLSPGVFDENGLKDAIKTWESFGSFKTGYGQAFCPMPEVPDLMTKYPTFDGSKEDNEVVAKWESGYGDFKGKLDAYLQEKDKLKAITVQFGTSDSYPWIPNGCTYLSKIMKEKNIAHELITIKEGGHSIPSDFVEVAFVPFFNKNLTY